MFKSQNFCHIASNNRNNVKAGMFIYRTTDDLATVTANGYFNDRIIDLNLHDIIVHEQIDNADPTKVKQNFLCVVQKTLTNVNTKIMDTDEVDGADTDLDNLSDTGKANISAKGTYDSNASYDAGTVGAAIQSKADAATSANTDLSNLTSTGANIGNWSSNVTNCITNIPQNINLTLSSGTLTLKAGSKCYLKTDTTAPSVTIASDLTATQTTDGTYFVIYDGSALTTVLTTAYTYTTLPDTYSLPLGVVTVSSGAISSIDNVFNGFGYIGSQVFTLPGVKGLYPNGRNADGTLKNGLVNCTAVQTSSVFNDTAQHCLFLNTNGRCQWYTRTDFYYDKETNIIRSSLNNVKLDAMDAGTFDTASGVISNFKPKTVFHAVDYSNSDYIANCAMPSSRYVDLTLGATGSSYTAPTDGYLTVNKSATASDQYINFINGSNGMNCNSIATSALPLRLYMPVSKGDVITINYDAAGTTTMFRFIYANGAK